jgi:AcrR family transcriptional regulator
MMKSLVEERHENAREEIKQVARKQMAEKGTASVGLRAIARELGLTAPAIYRYFPSLDDLILALIVDGFNDLADALEIADTTQPRDDYYNRLMTVLLAYRTWALAHPTDFQLIYGNPIPGFHAPPEITVPAVQRGFVVVITILVEALQAGKAHPSPEYLNVPPTVERTFLDIIEKDGYPITPQMLYLGITCWTRIHGMIMLELFHHLGPTVGDTDAFYCAEIERTVKAMGLQPKT